MQSLESSGKCYKKWKEWKKTRSKTSKRGPLDLFDSLEKFLCKTPTDSWFRICKCPFLDLRAAVYKTVRSSPPEVLLGKDILEICSSHAAV